MTFLVYDDFEGKPLPELQHRIKVNLKTRWVRAGFIVRTRIDADRVFRPARFEDAWRSGAQILTSDFTVGCSDLPAATVIYLPGNKTAVLGGENVKVE